MTDITSTITTPEAVSEERYNAQGRHLQLDVALSQETLDDVDDVVCLGARFDLGSGSCGDELELIMAQ